MKSYLIVLFLCLGSLSFAQQQGFSSDGKDFYLGYVYPSFNTNTQTGVNGFFAAYALISSYTNNQVTISYFTQTGQEIQGEIRSIPAKGAVQVLLQPGSMKLT